MDAQLLNTIGEPRRLQIIEALLEEPRSVSDLVSYLNTSQPTVSKHLRVLREAGIVRCASVAQQRIYRLESKPFRELDAWLQKYRALWNASLDALEKFLDEED